MSLWLKKMPKAQFVDDGAFVKVRVGASFVKSDSLAKKNSIFIVWQKNGVVLPHLGVNL